jgi:hypothetical protein
MKKLSFKSLKTLFSDEMLQKKIINYNYYYKYFIRQKLLKKKVINLIVDNDFNLSYFIQISRKFKKIFKKKKIIGSFLNTKNFVFKNRYNKNLTFSFPFFSQNVGKTPNNISIISNSLSVLLKPDFKNLWFLLRRPLKGGYCAFSNGIVGYLPRRELKSIILDSKLKKKDFVKNFSKLYNIFLRRKISTNLIYLCWISTKIAKIKLKLQGIKRKHSKIINKSSYKLMFIFLLKDSKIKRNLKKKYYVNKI